MKKVMISASLIAVVLGGLFVANQSEAQARHEEPTSHEVVSSNSKEAKKALAEQLGTTEDKILMDEPLDISEEEYKAAEGRPVIFMRESDEATKKEHVKEMAKHWNVPESDVEVVIKK